MENSKIEWTDHTFNPWIGCTKVSPACANCYAEQGMDKRLGVAKWGPNGTRVRTSPGNWKKPLAWNARCDREHFIECDNPECRHRRFLKNSQLESFCERCGDPAGNAARPRVFCASLADVFEDWPGPISDSDGVGLCICHGCGEHVSYVGNCGGDEPGCSRCPRKMTLDDVRRDLFALIDATPNLDWLLLTKRPENVRRMWLSNRRVVPRDGRKDAVDCLKFRPNVWLGTSVENQEQADRRIPELLKCRDLAPVLFLSMEPLLGPVDLETASNGCLQELSGEKGIDWIIAGGESGPHARPSHPDWFRSIRNQCKAAGVPFHFKQWGEWGETDDRCGGIQAPGLRDDTRHAWVHGVRMVRMARVGKLAAGRLLDGREWNELPKVEAIA